MPQSDSMRSALMGALLVSGGQVQLQPGFEQGIRSAVEKTLHDTQAALEALRTLYRFAQNLNSKGASTECSVTLKSSELLLKLFNDLLAQLKKKSKAFKSAAQARGLRFVRFQGLPSDALAMARGVQSKPPKKAVSLFALQCRAITDRSSG